MKKIIHIQPGVFGDEFGYQENLLLKYHEKLGYDVVMITSVEKLSATGKVTLTCSGSYYLDNNIKIVRLPFLPMLPLNISRRLRVLTGLREILLQENPDVIFVHGVQSLSIFQLVFYLKSLKPEDRPIVYVDNHVDSSNTDIKLHSYIMNRTLWRLTAKKLVPYTKKFYGVLPARVDYLVNIYKVPKDKVDFLPMGADDEKIVLEPSRREFLRQKIRTEYGFNQDDFIILTGGKIDIPKKQTLLLMKAIKRIQDDKVKLLVFGSVVDELKEEFMSLVDESKIKYIGWVKSDKVYDLAVASDLAVFPGRHSVIWEQIVGTGVPAVFKYWEGTTHVDIGGNCLFLYDDSEDEIYNILNRIINDKDFYNNMKNIALEKGPKTFLYSEIAKRAIEYEEGAMK